MSLNILVAYPYWKKEIEEILESYPGEMNLIVDSGAFSAHNSGITIGLNDYIGFIKGIQHKFKNFNHVQLDVVFNEKETATNYQRMLDAGLDPCPVFTRGADPEYFHQLLAQDKYVFVGGVQRGTGSKEFAKYCMSRSQGKKVHYLAFVRPEFLKAFKPYSVDSSSWSSCARYGAFQLYTGNGKLKTIQKKDFASPPSPEVVHHLRLTGFKDVEIMKLRKAEAWINRNQFDNRIESKFLGSYASFVNMCSHLRMYHEVEKRLGTKIYVAVGQIWQTKMVVAAYEQLKERGVIR